MQNYLPLIFKTVEKPGLSKSSAPALAFWWPYANSNLAAPDHRESKSMLTASYHDWTSS